MNWESAGKLVCGLFISAVLLCVAPRVAIGQSETSSPLSDAQIRARVDALIEKMTPEEKAGQLIKINGQAAGGPGLDDAIKAGHVGSLAYIRKPESVNRYQKLAMEQSRLKIPLLFAMDMIHGERTIFPVPIAFAATWDPELVESANAMEAREARAVGLTWTFAPMLDISRDPRWGRIVEGVGEDPYLASAMARAEVRGLQGPALGSNGHILAGPKHFAAYGAAIGGRDYAEVNVSESDLWNIYLPPFEAAIKSGAGNVMTAYMPLNGIPCAANSWLIKDILRKQWGFKGFTVSDANNINALVKMAFASDPTDAAIRALKAGEDMESGFVKPAYETLPGALASGKLDVAELNEAVRHVLEVKMRMGLFEHPYVDESKSEAALSDPASREKARIVAESSAVLLRNENHLLPLHSDTVKSIAVIGPLADSKADILGPWAFDEKPEETVTILEGLRARAGQKIKVEFAPGAQMPIRKFPSFFDRYTGYKSPQQANFDSTVEMNRAVALASHSDVTVLVLGESQNMDGEASSSSTLALPGEQQALLEAVVATGKPVVLLLMTARPVEIRWASTHVPAIMDIWYPGTKGGEAVANLLFGDSTPSGKLPFTWVRDVGQVPFPYDFRESHQPDTNDKRYFNEESTPLFPFGYGKSYTTFTFENLRLSQASIAAGGTVSVSVDVHNDGGIKGEEIAQLYIHQRYGSATRPRRELKGFQKIMLLPGESKTVTFELGPSQLRYWSTAMKSYVLEPSTYDVWVGEDSTATLTQVLEVK